MSLVSTSLAEGLFAWRIKNYFLRALSDTIFSLFIAYLGAFNKAAGLLSFGFQKSRACIELHADKEISFAIVAVKLPSLSHLRDLSLVLLVTTEYEVILRWVAFLLNERGLLT